MSLTGPDRVSAVEIVRCIYDAYESGDARTPADHFDDDARGYTSDFVPWGGHRRGRQDLREGLATLRFYITNSFEPSEIIDSGNEVIAVGRTVGLINATGQTFSVPTVHVWHFEGGKIVAFENYLDKGIVKLLGIAT
jgi:ketosteroid isomerase-like protein